MKLTAQARQDICSATITQTLWLMLACSVVLMVTTYASPPAWWATRSATVSPVVTTNSGVVTTNYVTNDYAVLTQGQLKLFTARAVDELNTNLTSWGAGTNLNNLVQGWTNDYYTNHYSTTNIEPSDYKAMNVGQLKYVGSLVWNRLYDAGYVDSMPYWLYTNSIDNNLANIGQLKTVFNFDISSFSDMPHVTSSSTNGTIGTSFSYTNSATGSPTSYDAIGLPPGLGISGSTISGTPTAKGTFVITLSATNPHGTGYGFLTLAISLPVPQVTSATTASATVGTLFDYDITANNNPTSFNATNLPSGLSLDTNSGIILGTPTMACTNTVGLSASNAGGTGPTTNLTLTVTNPSAPVITSGPLPDGTVGDPYSYTVVASNNPTNFSESGLPGTLNLDTNTGVITGTPTATSTNTVVLSASNAGGTGSVTNTFVINGTYTPVITSPLTAYAVYGTAFNYQITATHTPTSFGETGTLPTGLSLNTTNGLISGSPPAGTSTSNVTISASNGSGTGNATLTIIVNPAVPVITSGSATGTIGTSFIYQIAASGSPTSYSASGLPAGLSLDTTSGVISGTPTVAGSYTVALGAANQGGSATAGSLSLTINPGIPAVPVITSGSMVTGAVSNSFLYTITAENNPTNYSIVSGSVSGLNLTNFTSGGVPVGEIVGTPTTAGTNIVTIGASNAGGTGTNGLIVIIEPAGTPVITATTATGTVGATFNYTISASNTPTSMSATGLPVGLTLTFSAGVGTITGTPRTVGASLVTINAANGVGTGVATLLVTINPPAPVINSATTASGTFGVTITNPYRIMASNSPTSFSATNLPPGLRLDPFTGVISGTPTAAGTYTMTLSATNAGGTGTATLTYTIGTWTGNPIVTQSIANGDFHTLLLKSDGTVWAAGSNGSGQLGNGSYTDTTSYTKVSTSTGLTGVIAVAAGGHCSLALTSDGKVWAWGENYAGELGNGSNTNNNLPGQVTVSGGSPLTGIIAIACGESHNMALKSNGTVWAWGFNNEGELGNGNTTDSNRAVQVNSTGLTDAIAIACGADHTIAINSDGTVWCWGQNVTGCLGENDGTINDSDVPVQVSGLTGVISVAGGYFYSVALKSDGTVWAWGDETDGLLGNGVTSGDTASTGPVQVSNLSGITAISCGRGDHTLALKSDGTVWAWGLNDVGQLGNGTTTASSVPVQVSNLTGVMAIFAGTNYNLILKSDLSVWGWGGDLIDSSIPIPITTLAANPAPTISPAPGYYSSSTAVSISAASGTIHYTLDGTTPTASSPIYTQGTTTINLSGSALVSAMVINGTNISPIASSQFYIAADSGDTGLPTAPTNSITSVISGSEIDLSWAYSSGPANYNAVNVYRSTNGGTNYQLIATLDPSATNYVDTNVLGGTNYLYDVGTYNSSGQTTNAATSSVSPPTTTNLDIYVTTPSGATNLP